MLIGIDMLAVQASEGGNHEAGRYGRQLVDTILARNTSDHFLLYTHEGWPTDLVPTSSRRVTRKMMAPVASVGPARLRPAVQRLLDGNPDGLDWMVLLDPFSPHYGGVPPESPLGPLKLASVIHDLSVLRGDDRSLAPLRRYEAIFAVSGHTAAQCRVRLGSASSRVATLNVAAAPGFAAPDVAEPLSKAAGDDLGRLGVSGPFFFHVAGKTPTSANLDALLAIYARLPIEHRHRHRLVVAGTVDGGHRVRQALAQQGLDGGLILVGEVPEATLRTLYSRCSAFLSPAVEEGSGLSLVEAMTAGAPVIAGRTGTQAEIVGDAGLLVDPLDPDEVAAELAELLGNADLERDLRKRSIARSAAFGWDSVVDSVLAVLSDGQTPAAASTPNTAVATTRLRVDSGHTARPRVAYFPSLAPDPSGRLDLPGQIPAGWLDLYNVDFYFESDHASLADGLPVEFGGFDVRLFDRNDNLLGYHAVIHRVGDAGQVDRVTARLARRPGLVLLEDDSFLDAILPEPARATRPANQLELWTLVEAPGAPDFRSDATLVQVRDLLRTGSAVVVRSPRHFDVLHESLGEQAETITLVPLDATPGAGPTPARRASARARLDLWAETVVIGQFAPAEGGLDALLGPKAFRAILKTAPDVVLLTFTGGAPAEKARLAREAKRLGLSDRFLLAPAVEAGQVADVAAMLDLAIHPGGTPTGPSVSDLLRAGVPTLALGGDLPPHTPYLTAPSSPARSLARQVRDLALDPEARSALGQSGRDYVLGVADPVAASTLLVELIERCAHELPRASGRKPQRPASGSSPRKMTYTPHFSRPASATNEAATGRGER